jgi:hypothetical protein
MCGIEQTAAGFASMLKNGLKRCSVILNRRDFLMTTLAVVGGAGHAGSIAARRRARALAGRQDDAGEIGTWEGEGGNGSPAVDWTAAAPDASPASAEQ